MPTRIVLAPMAGVSIQAFRRQGRRFGAGLVCSEMVSAAGIEHRNERTFGYLRVAADEHPLAIQIFGADPAAMADAARMVEAAGADIVDMNFGCPVRKVTKTGAGAHLMEDRGARLPGRRGGRGRGRRAGHGEDAARRRERLARVPRARAAARRGRRGGADAPSPLGAADVHRRGRPRASRRSSSSACDVPVIASGDVTTREEAIAVLERTGAAAVMVARGAQGNPWALREMIEGESFAPTREEVAAELVVFIREAVRELGEQRAVGFLKKFYGWYLGHGRFPKPFKQELVQLASAPTASTRMIAIVRTGAASNTWRPFLRPPSRKRQAKHEQAVAEDRADQRGLGQHDEAIAQGEDRDEQLGQVAQRRLEHARRPRAEVTAEVIRALADEPRDPGQRRGRDDEDDHVRRPGEAERAGQHDPGDREADHHQRRATEHGGDPGRRLGGLVGHRPTLAAAAAPCQPENRTANTRHDLVMSLRYHEISEANHRILNPFTEEKLRLLGEICGRLGRDARAGSRVRQGRDALSMGRVVRFGRASAST